jgi:hypothetical protein
LLELPEKTIPWAITDLIIKVAKEKEKTQEKLVEEHTEKPVKIELSILPHKTQNVP